MSGAAFSGWPSEALAFYEGLEADNSKAYWTANKATYEEAVRAPMDALSAAVADEFGELVVFRPYRDVRFSKDKTPYKTAIGAVTEGEGGEVYYVEFSAAGLVAASGLYHLAPDQLERHRAAIDDDALGTELEGIVARLEAAGYTIGAHGELRTAPRGYRRDHPRIRLLRLKGLIASRRFPPAAWLSSPSALKRVVETWRGSTELGRWLGRHVGPSTLPPPELDRA
ncbi:MAG: TIGR02453 family protein [Acidimicrobiia bacterium]|nr:TIGR02453 family protein [Acidimicrobiia bacterium]